jgi:dihydrofolate reductase
MGLIRLYMTMSLDGYVAGPGDGVDAPMGIGGFRLFNWLDRRNDPGPNRQVFSELMSTRAVISGRRTYEHAGRWQGDHHDGIPVFVLTHDVPGDPPPGSVRYITDVDECAARARGDGDVLVHGQGRRRRCCVPDTLTNWNCTSYRSCSGRADGCSTTCQRSTSSSACSGAWPLQGSENPRST